MRKELVNLSPDIIMVSVYYMYHREDTNLGEGTNRNTK